MNSKIVLDALQNLASGSIEEISTETRLAANDVKNTLAWLIEIGAPVKRTGSDNFQLLRPIVPLDKNIIRESIRKLDTQLANRIRVYDQVDSTNENLIAKIGKSSPHKHVCIAEYMTAGRGRRQRPWFGGAYENVMLSVAWDFGRGVEQISGLSLAVAVVVANCLNSITEEEFRVKWPNDILWQNRKISGILIETQNTTAVVGIGINCAMTKNAKKDIGKPVVCLEDITGTPVDRNHLVSKLLGSLSTGLELFADRKLEPFHDEWMRLHAHTGLLVRTDGSRQQEGTVIGIDMDGALLLQKKNREIFPVHSGEISVQPIN